MRTAVTNTGAVLAVLAVLAAGPGEARAQVEPFPSFNFLPTGNGFGFQIFDANANAVKQFLERPYRFIRPNPTNPDGEGVLRRNLAFDTYFGVRTPSESAWLSQRTPSQVGYVDQTNIIRSVVQVGSLKTESFYWAPYGYEGNAMVMVLRVTNEGSAAQAASAFSVHNFKLGSAPNPDQPGANNETVRFEPATQMATETGPGGGTMLYIPIGGVDVSSCAESAWASMAAGSAIGAMHDCTGNDRVNVFQRDLGSIPAGESRSFGVAVLFAADQTVAATRAAWDAFAGDKDPEALLAAALAEFEAWRVPVPGLSGDELRVWRQSETVLRMGQILEPYSENPKRKNHGMILASLPPGGWHIGWVRDGVYAIIALARVGHYEEAKKGLNFFLDAEAGKFRDYLKGVDYRISTVRYFGNGEEESDFSGQPTRNIEIDGWGLVLWAARTYVDFSGDVDWLNERTAYGDTVYEALRDGVAEPLAMLLEPQGMPTADTSIWEVHWGNREHFTYTAATTSRGFCDMAGLARYLEDYEDRDRYKDLHETVNNALGTYFVDQNNVFAGSIERLARGSNYRDGAVTEVFTWGLFPPEDPRTAATMNAFSFLRTPVGGYKRIEGSSDQYDSDQWILIDLRASQVHRMLGQTQQADLLVDFITRQAAVNFDLVPELYNTTTSAGQLGRYTGAIPMVGYGGGAYMIALLERAGYTEYQDCGTEDPPAGGGPDYGDAGVGGGGGGDGPGGSLDRTGAACMCRAASPDAGDGLLLTLVLLGFAWTMRRRAKGQLG